MNSFQIVIVGFMGCGKTTVAFELARKLNCQAIDLDDLIAQRETRGPQKIIEQDGEAVFRTIESRMLREVLLEVSPLVLAVGGGAWTIVENRQMIMTQGALSVWLDTPFELCWQRIEPGGKARPLAPTREMAKTLYNARLPIYALANVRIPVEENERAEEIASRVAHLVSSQNS